MKKILIKMLIMNCDGIALARLLLLMHSTSKIKSTLASANHSALGLTDRDNIGYVFSKYH